ncbi:MAG: hypothetical protein L6R28_01995 [Planctomycetes bacterium]|nr:hypothetical protein [Planctomycetota bacterium]
MRTPPIWAWAACAATLQLVALAGDAQTPSFEAAPDAELLGKLEALPANTWMKLPPPKILGDLAWLSPRADERHRGPFGRSYCGHAFWAPERKRALYCGGGHNVRPINDVWEYDLAANAWICLHGADPGFAPTEEWFRAHAMLRDGAFATKCGAPVRMTHQWDQAAYDPVRKRLVFIESMPRGLHYGTKLETPGNAAEKGLGLDHETFLKKLGPDGIYAYEFDPAQRAWTRAEYVVNWKGPGNTTGGRQESGILEYLPDRKTLFFLGAGKSLLRDAEKGTWTPVDGGPRTYGMNGVYDPDAKKVIAIAGRKTLTYALGQEQKGWTTAIEEGPAEGNDASATMFYDPLAKKVVLYSLSAKPNLWLYDTARNEWTDPKPAGEAPAANGERIVYHDPARNVLVYYNSKDVWVYRCTRAAQ